MSDAICEVIAAGGYIATAASKLGIPRQTIDAWRAIGEGRHENRPMREPYVTFARKVAEAEAQSEWSCIKGIREAGEGGRTWEEQIIEERFRTVTIAATDGQPEQTLQVLVSRKVRRIQKVAEPAWTAFAWLLERRFPDRWKKRDATSIELPGSAVLEVPPKVEDYATWMATYSPHGVPQDWQGGNGHDPTNGSGQPTGPTNGGGNGEAGNGEG